MEMRRLLISCPLAHAQHEGNGEEVEKEIEMRERK